MTTKVATDEADGRPVVRPTHGTDTALRLTVIDGSGAPFDLVAPYGTVVADVAGTYAEQAGRADVPALALASGTLLDPDTTVDDLEQGEVLVVVAPDAPASAVTPGPTADHPAAARPALLGRAAAPVLALVGALALLTALVGALAQVGGAAPSWAQPLVAAVLAVGALATAGRAASIGTAVDHAHVVAPALAAAAGFVLAYTGDSGDLLLAVAVAGLAACVVAAVARTGAEPVGEHLLRAWLVVGGIASASAVVWLLVGAGPVSLACVAFAVAVVATRLLPGLAVDVDDDVLLDLDRLAVTAWSARETPRGGRRRHQVRAATVRDVAARSGRTVVAGVLVVAVVAAVAGPVVVLAGDRTPWAAGGALAMVAAGAAALALVGRSFRSRLPRAVLGACACWLTLLCGAVLASRLEGPWLWYAFAGVAAVAALVLLAAVQLGRGWRSVWWARAGEVVETLVGVTVVALLPLAAGLFDLIRTSFS